MRSSLVVGALLLALSAPSLDAQASRAPKTAADSMLAIIRARANAGQAAISTEVVPAPARAARPAAAERPRAVTAVSVSAAGPDTVWVRDTVLTRDTVIVKDTIVKRDTLFVAPAPAAAPAAPRATSSAAPAASRIAEVGFGSLKVNGLLQFQFGASNTATASSFRIRRAELKLSGRISPIVSWATMFDVSKPLSLSNGTTTVNGTPVVSSSSVNQGSRLMQDAILTVDLTKNLHVDAGQFRLPLGNIGSGSSANLETIERPMFQADRARGGALGDIRDIGFVVRGPATSVADYWIGAFNGAGESQNTTDANNQKTVVGRVTFKTPVNGLRFGGSALYSGVDTTTPLKKDRYGAEITFIRGKYLARVEAQHGTDAAIDRMGGFALVGYRVIPRLQIVARVDSWDPDVSRDDTAGTARATDLMAGATYQLAGDNAKLQVNLSRRQFAGDVLRPTSQLLVNLQASW